MTARGLHPVRWNCTVGPTIEPVTRGDYLKNFARVDSDLTQDDGLFDLLISTARQYAENYTGLSLNTQTWRATMDAFPGFMVPQAPFAGIAAWIPSPQPDSEIPLLHGPVTAVVAVTYLDSAGVAQTMAPTDYVLDTSGLFPRIAPAHGKAWPATLPQIGAVTIDITTGYGPATTDIPAGIRHWILLRVNTIYRNREEVAILNRGKVEALPFVDSLLDYYRHPTI